MIEIVVRFLGGKINVEVRRVRARETQVEGHNVR